MGGEEALTPVDAEPLLGYHPCSIGFLTSSRDPAGGQCQVGSLTGAVASERVSEALNPKKITKEKYEGHMDLGDGFSANTADFKISKGKRCV